MVIVLRSSDQYPNTSSSDKSALTMRTGTPAIVTVFGRLSMGVRGHFLMLLIRLIAVSIPTMMPMPRELT